jgi:hypothetical protein
MRDDEPESVRDAIGQSQHGAPAAGAVLRDQFETHEVLYLVFLGEASLVAGLVGFVLPVLPGNTVGGVVPVTVVKYFQTTEERLDIARRDGADRRLTGREWLVGTSYERSYVPEQPEEEG